MENKEDGKEKQKSGFVINIPSYQEEIDISQPKTTASTLFNPSPSFSQSSFIKKFVFYVPPPPPPPPPPPSPPPSQPLNVPAPREIGNAASSSSTSQNAPSRNAILVSFRQTGNLLLKHIRNVRWAFADIVCDYLLGPNSCALYLSLRYHLLHPDYLYYRIRELQNNFKLKVVLCHVDVEDVNKPLLEVTKTALLHDCTLLCGWSLEECGRYLETIKVYENKPADIIQGQMDTDYLSRLTHTLTTVQHVNKTDVVTLGSAFGTLSHIMDASMEDLSRCPGIGERKVKRLYDTFHEPFKREIAKRPSTSEAPLDLCPETEGKEGKEVAEASKRNEKKPELTVKSALAASFARHKEKVGERNQKPQGGKGPEESGSEDSKPGNKNSSEEARS